METKKKKLIAELGQKLLAELKVEAEVKVEVDQEGAVRVQIETAEPGVLIGYHGETLASLQLILALMVYRQLGEWVRLVVNVGDYRQRREESLRRLALSAAQKVKFSGEAYALPAMTPAERRIIHLTLADDQEVTTESEGEGRNRRVVVKPKE